MTDQATDPAATTTPSSDDQPAPTEAQRGRGPRGARGPRGPREDRDRGPRGGQPFELRDSRGRRIDTSPPKFNVDELQALAGAPLWQAVHMAEVVEVQDGTLVVNVQPEGHAPLKAAVRSVEWEGASVGARAHVRLLDPPTATTPLPLASRRQAEDLTRFNALQQLGTQEQKSLVGEIVHEVKGGFAVALDPRGEVADGAVRAFLPFSQASMNRFGPSKQEKLLGLKDTFDITEFDLGRMNFVVSRKSRLVAARNAELEKRLATISEGSVVSGVVESIVAYGAFLDVDGLDALLHRDDLAWDFRGRIDAHLKVGQRYDVKVLAIKDRKLKVGLKQTKVDPWAEVRAAFTTGTVVKGVIVSLADFGAFVRLALPSSPTDSVEGLIHVSEISYAKVKHPSNKFSIGQEVDVKVLGLDTDNRRISLSTKALEKNPFEAVAEKFPAGTVIRAKIKSLAEFGAFLELADGVDGLVHVSELSWTESPEHPSQVVTIGQEVEAVVMGVEVAKQRVSCSIKRTGPNPFDGWEKKYQPGTRLSMKVIKVEEKGCFLEVESGLSCYCSWRDLVDAQGSAVERATDAVKQGQEIEVQVRSFERRFKKVSVSMKAVVDGDTKAAYEEYKQREQGGRLNSLGDALKKKLDPK
jgi:small subunit ribosomal protein S1